MSENSETSRSNPTNVELNVTFNSSGFPQALSEAYKLADFPLLLAPHTLTIKVLLPMYLNNGGTNPLAKTNLKMLLFLNSFK